MAPKGRRPKKPGSRLGALLQTARVSQIETQRGMHRRLRRAGYPAIAEENKKPGVTVSNWERGRRSPDPKYLHVVAHVFRVSVDELVLAYAMDILAAAIERITKEIGKYLPKNAKK